MLAEFDRIEAEGIVKASIESRFQIPFFSSYVQAGFPSPADNYLERVCDLNDLCVTNAESTYFVRVTSDSMTGDRIEAGDVLVVDCSREVADGKIIIAWYNGGHTVKRIHFAGGPSHGGPSHGGPSHGGPSQSDMIVLMPSNTKYEPIYVHPGDDFKIFGVVTFVIHKPL